MRKIKPILIVDDDLDLKHLLAEALGEEGYRVSLASHGVEALNFLKASLPQELPDLIILDSRMPYMNGSQFITELTRLKRFETTHIPIIWSSAASEFPTEYITLRIKRIPKPFEVQEMIQPLNTSPNSSLRGAD